MEINTDIVIQAFDRKPLVTYGEYKFLINPLTEQIPATSAELLRATTNWLISEGDFKRADKIAGEEDKGAILVASTSLATSLPFGMARWYPSGLTGQIAVDFDMEYTSGRLYLNGVDPGDKVIVVDDMISSGGTMLALIKALHQADAKIVDIICVAEKVDYGGIKRVYRATGYQVKVLISISMAGEISEVLKQSKG
jgi:adenine/guanine phosphoribosyltransferase-like PRPP-binding protein